MRNLSKISAAGLTLALLVTTVACSPDDERQITCTVYDKDRTKDSDSNSVYQIYTDQCDVLRIWDEGGHNDSASRYNQIRIGQTYVFTVWHHRKPNYSEFPNIIYVSPAPA